MGGAFLDHAKPGVGLTVSGAPREVSLHFAVVGFEDPFREPVVADELFYSLSMLPDAIAPYRRITVARQDEAVAWCRRRTAKTPVPNGSGSSGLSKTSNRARLDGNGGLLGKDKLKVACHEQYDQ